MMIHHPRDHLEVEWDAQHVTKVFEPTARDTTGIQLHAVTHMLRTKCMDAQHATTMHKEEIPEGQIHTTTSYETNADLPTSNQNQVEAEDPDTEHIHVNLEE